MDSSQFHSLVRRGRRSCVTFRSRLLTQPASLSLSRMRQPRIASMQMELYRLFGRGRLKIKDSVVQDVGYLDKRVSGDLCLRTYLIESQSLRRRRIRANVEETRE